MIVDLGYLSVRLLLFPSVSRVKSLKEAVRLTGTFVITVGLSSRATIWRVRSSSYLPPFRFRPWKTFHSLCDPRRQPLHSPPDDPPGDRPPLLAHRKRWVSLSFSEAFAHPRSLTGMPMQTSFERPKISERVGLWIAHSLKCSRLTTFDRSTYNSALLASEFPLHVLHLADFARRQNLTFCPSFKNS